MCLRCLSQILNSILFALEAKDDKTQPVASNVLLCWNQNLESRSKGWQDLLQDLVLEKEQRSKGFLPKLTPWLSLLLLLTFFSTSLPFLGTVMVMMNSNIHCNCDCWDGCSPAGLRLPGLPPPPPVLLVRPPAHPDHLAVRVFHHSLFSEWLVHVQDGRCPQSIGLCVHLPIEITSLFVCWVQISLFQIDCNLPPVFLFLPWLTRFSGIPTLVYPFNV